jgi:hypothetical protein
MIIRLKSELEIMDSGLVAQSKSTREILLHQLLFFDILDENSINFLLK